MLLYTSYYTLKSALLRKVGSLSTDLSYCKINSKFLTSLNDSTSMVLFLCTKRFFSSSIHVSMTLRSVVPCKRWG